jgi:hypothetical protein
MAQERNLLRARRIAATWLVVAGSVAGCGKNVVEDFPLSVGFQPLESVSTSVTFPPAAGNELYPQEINVVAGPQTGHYASHGRGYLHASLATVYQALHDPAASYIHNHNGAPRLEDVPGNPFMGEENPPFPVSFRVRYASPTGIPGYGDAKFDITYRAGPLEGTEAAPVKIGERYQKTWGIQNIEVMSGSLVATEVAPGITAVEMVAWLKATTQDQSDCDGTVRDLYGNLVTKLAAMP